MTPEELNDRCIARLREADLAARVAVVGSGPSSPYMAPIGKLEEFLAKDRAMAGLYGLVGSDDRA